jgi:hypothetical protein
MAKIVLEDLRKLKDDWDDDGGLAPTEAALQLAEKILNMQPTVVPRSDGGVQIEWPMAGAEICITPEGTLEYE